MRALVNQHWATIADMVDRRRSERQWLHRRLDAIFRNFGSSLLTTREQDVVQLMLRGHPAKSIAAELEISTGTVNVHRSHIYEKLDVSSNSGMFSLLIDALLVADPDPKKDILSGYM